MVTASIGHVETVAKATVVTANWVVQPGSVPRARGPAPCPLVEAIAGLTLSLVDKGLLLLRDLLHLTLSVVESVTAAWCRTSAACGGTRGGGATAAPSRWRWCCAGVVLPSPEVVAPAGQRCR